MNFKMLNTALRILAKALSKIATCYVQSPPMIFYSHGIRARLATYQLIIDMSCLGAHSLARSACSR